MQRVTSLLPLFFKELPRDEAVRLRFLRGLWPQMVGGELAKNTEPIQLKDRRLLVAVPSAVWMHQLEPLVPRVVEAVNRFWGDKVVGSVILEVSRTRGGSR